MKILLLVIALLCLAHVSPSQWIKQPVNTTASLRGLSVVNDKIIWASGTDGTVIRTIDGGKTWKVMTVPGAEKLDFRDVEAFDANTAYILSIGNGESSRIYKTTDGGKTWKEQFRNKNEKAFFDAIACWDKNNCIAMSDPVDKKFVLIETKNGGTTWTQIDTSKMPEAKDGETAFAASGTCLIAQGHNNAFLVTGGSAARVFRSNNRGLSWFVAETPITKGTSGSGIFSIAMFDEQNGVIVGGNYEKPDEAMDNFASTSDGGTTWKLGTGLTGYRSAVAQITRWVIVSAGTNGADISLSRGKNWSSVEMTLGAAYKTNSGFNAIASLRKSERANQKTDLGSGSKRFGSSFSYHRFRQMNWAWYDILGTLGVGVIILAYILLQIGRLRSEQLAYSVMNAVGAVLILISLYYSFNFSSFVVEFFWLIISLFGIGKYLAARRK